MLGKGGDLIPHNILKEVKGMFRKIEYIDWCEFSRKAEIQEVFEFQQECRNHNVGQIK